MKEGLLKLSCLVICALFLGGIVHAEMVPKIVWQSEASGNKDIWMMSLDKSDKIQLTFYPGKDANPMISPDGTMVAFYSDRTGEYQIWVLNLQTKILKQVTTEGGNSPVWSPDGRIFFNMGSTWEVSAIYPDGSGLTYIGELGANPSMSPDGSQIAYYPRPNSNPNSYDLYVASSIDGSNRVNLSNVAGLGGFERPNGLNAWGSNGKILIMAQEPRWSSTSGYGIWWVADDGSGSGVIFDEPGHSDGLASWSPDETQIIFTSTKGTGDFNLWITDAHGNNPIQLTDDPAEDIYPHWGYVDIDPVDLCDGYPNKVVDTLQVDQQPSDIALMPDESVAYTAGSTGDTFISAVNLSDGTVTEIPVGNTPWGVAVSRDGQHVYASNYNDDTVSIIQTSDNTVIDTVNVGDGPIWLASSNAYVYVANYEGGTVSVIRRWDNHVFDPITVGVNPQAIVVTPDQSHVYVANRGGESVSVIRASDRSVVKTIPVTGEPAHMAISPDGSKVYVSRHLLNQVSVIDTASNEIVGDPIEVGYRPVKVAVTPNGQYLFVLRHYADEFDVVDTATESIADVISVGDGPYDMAFSEDGCRLYVPNHHDGRLMVLEAFNNQPPVAEAGDNVIIFARYVVDTTVNGNGWDEDGDALDCRWLQDEHVLVDWIPTAENGDCLLPLDVFLPDVGEHTLTLEVSDGLLTSSDQMVLHVEEDIPSDVIAEICPCDDKWRNHRQYLRCVSRQARKFFRDNLITKQERRSIIRNARRSDCGKKCK